MPTRVVLNAVMSPCRSLRIPGTGTTSAASRLFEGGLEKFLPSTLMGAEGKVCFSPYSQFWT